MKLLVMCDSPTIPSGFAKVGSNLVRRWAAMQVEGAPVFERIDWWAIGYRGWPGKPGSVQENWWVKLGITLYPQTRGKYWYDAENLQDFLDLVVTGDYTHIFIVQDHFVLTLHDFHRTLQQATNRLFRQVQRDVRVIYYAPVDGVVDADWSRICNAADAVVAYTEFGKGELERNIGRLNRHHLRVFEPEGRTGCPRSDGGSDGQFGPEIRVIPHGCDTSIYRPLGWSEEERFAERKEAFPDHPDFIQPGDVLLLNVNVNQRRKDVARTMEIFARLKSKADVYGSKRVKLLMHMNRVSAGDGLDLEVIGRQLGLRLGVDWMHSGALFAGNYGQLNEEQLNRLYNLADIYITTTLGEGWGFGITEAAAAGCAVALPTHTSCGEIGAFMESAGMLGVVWLPLEQGCVWLPGDNCRPRRRVDIDKAVDALWVRLVSSPRPLPLRNESGLAPAMRGWLDWDWLATEWVVVIQGGVQASEPPVKRPVHYYLEYGGGLGDVINGLYRFGSYHLLRDLKDGETATVALVCCNPHAKEIFERHPRVKSGQVQVLDCGYWDPPEDARERPKRGLAKPGSVLPFENKVATVKEGYEWYLTDQDAAQLRALWNGQKYFVIAAGAGLNDRNFPREVLNAVCLRLLEAFPDHVLVVTGRDFARFDKREPYPGLLVTEQFPARVLDLRNQLTVPGTALLLQKATGLVTCHSALNILGWQLVVNGQQGIPQLLLYPESVLERHFAWTTPEGKAAGRRRDQWSFGVENGKTVHGLFERHAELTERFVRMFLGHRDREEEAQRLEVGVGASEVQFVDLPDEVKGIALYGTPGWTVPHEVRMLLALAGQTRHGILEIGCNTGQVTREFAWRFKDRMVLGLDYVPEGGGALTMASEQRGEVPVQIGSEALHLGNVRVLNCNSRALRWAEMEVMIGSRFDFIFIDGDHSYEGVKADSEQAVEYLRARGGGVIAWHDCSESHPEWVGVWKYLQELAAHGVSIVRVKGTWLAYTVVESLVTSTSA